MSCRAARKSSDACDACPEPHLLPENQRIRDIYIACQTQWMHRESGARTGLNYPAVEVVLRAMGINDNGESFFKLQVVEHEMVRVDLEREAKQAR